MVDGIVVDARQLPRAMQEVAYERGMIPYLPEVPAPQTSPPTAARAAKKGRSN
jgi:hypothetical protein